jgi:hypothetical protein
MVNFSFKDYLWRFKWVLRREGDLNPKGTFIIWWVILKMQTLLVLHHSWHNKKYQTEIRIGVNYLLEQ